MTQVKAGESPSVDQLGKMNKLKLNAFTQFILKQDNVNTEQANQCILELQAIQDEQAQILESIQDSQDMVAEVEAENAKKFEEIVTKFGLRQHFFGIEFHEFTFQTDARVESKCKDCNHGLLCAKHKFKS